MTFTHGLATNNYGTAKFIVSSSAANGTHTTIASAITAASSGDTIFIRPGTYTENLTLKAGVNLTAYECDTGNVIIVGKATMTTAGTVNISGIRLQTNSDFLLAVTGSAASIVNLMGCYLNISNNTGISFTSSDTGSQIAIRNCTGNLGTTGIAAFAHSGAGGLYITNTTIFNSGSSTTASTVSGSGTLQVFYFYGQFAISVSSTAALAGGYSIFNCDGINTTALTLTSTTGSSLFHSSFFSGTDSAISVGTGAELTIDHATVNSGNANAITGNGTVNYGLIVYTDGSTNNAATQNALSTQPAFGGGGGGKLVQQVRASTNSTVSTNSAIPPDGSIPQNSEGAELITATITPTSSTNALVIQFQFTFNVNTSISVSAALFQDSTANALYAVGQYKSGADSNRDLIVSGIYYMTAGTTSATTFKVRFGPVIGSGGDLVYVNGGLYGGVEIASLIVSEIEV